MLNLYQSREEVDLQNDLIDEYINIYGIPCKFYFMDYYRKNVNAFNDIHHLEFVDYEEIKVILENNSSYENGFGFNFSKFGLQNNDNLSIFASPRLLDKLSIKFKDLIGNVIQFPSNALFEITDVEIHTEGINNNFILDNPIARYKIYLKRFAINAQNATDDLKSTLESSKENIDAIEAEIKRKFLLNNEGNKLEAVSDDVEDIFKSKYERSI